MKFHLNKCDTLIIQPLYCSDHGLDPEGDWLAGFYCNIIKIIVKTVKNIYETVFWWFIKNVTKYLIVKCNWDLLKIGKLILQSKIFIVFSVAMWSML